MLGRKWPNFWLCSLQSFSFESMPLKGSGRGCELDKDQEADQILVMTRWEQTEGKQWGGMIPPTDGGLEAQRGRITCPQWSGCWVASRSFRGSPTRWECPCFTHQLSDESKKQPACVHALSFLPLLTDETKWSHWTWLLPKKVWNHPAEVTLKHRRVILF